MLVHQALWHWPVLVLPSDEYICNAQILQNLFSHLVMFPVRQQVRDTSVYSCVVDELKKADELNHSLRSQLHESRQLAVSM